ncbi:MAG: LmbE family N-acetylglucosaminyl deacetylase [Planctomycetota bacterium]|jgi:LmbE family N-acetylglucosaminyl deacetylase
MTAAYFREWEPLLPPTGISSGPLVVLSPHPDDEVIGAGGLILGHRLAGEHVSVLVMTDGRMGDPGGDQSDAYVALREKECRAAGVVLDSQETSFLGFHDGGLAELFHQDCAATVDKLTQKLGETPHGTLALPSPFELHPDHKATFLLGFEAWTARGRNERLILYEVGSLMPCNLLLDITVVGDKKDEALGCYASQLVHHDITAKVRALDIARCANIPDQAVKRCEGYLEVKPKSADEFRRLVDELLQVTDGMRPGISDE